MGQTTKVEQNNITNNSIKYIEQEVHNSVKNMNVDLSKLDLSSAIKSFEQLAGVLKTATFETFINNIVKLQEVFDGFQKKVSSATGSVTKFANNVPQFKDSVVVTNIEVNTPDVGAQSAEIASSVDTASKSVSSAATAIGDSFKLIGASALEFGAGMSAATSGITELLKSAAALCVSVGSLGSGLQEMAAATVTLIPLLPSLGTSVLQMAVNMSGLLAYVPELIVFVGVMTAFSLLGEGLNLAGTGIFNIGAGLTSMSEGLLAVIAFMPILIESLAGITNNIGGIIIFVLLAAAMFLMAVAMEKINEQIVLFRDSLAAIGTTMNVGFVAAFTVFALMIVLMSAFLEKVANGLNKVSQSMDKQIAKLAVLNPLLAAQAILLNPIMGAVTVALAIAGGLLVKTLLPAMATGGVVSSPTVAMVGEGRYPEAVVPLGDSPQFSSMKADIANAVIQAIGITGGNNGRNQPIELTINLDSRAIAKQLYSPLQLEAARRG